jgi:hypothetical protein
LKSSNPNQRRSRQVLPKISKAFPKDFFNDSTKNDPDQDYDFEISMKFTSKKAPLGEVESFLNHFQNYLSTKDLITVGNNGIENDDPLVISSSRGLEKNSSRSHLPQKKLQKLISIRGSQGKESNRVYQMGNLPQMTFGDYYGEPRSVEVRAKKGVDNTIFTHHFDVSDKENIPPMESSRGNSSYIILKN